MSLLDEIIDDVEALRAKLARLRLEQTVQPPSPEAPPRPPLLVPATLQPEDYQWASTALSCDIATIKAVCAVESNGRGFAPDGRPIILFEPHIFSRLTGHRFDATQGGVSYPKWGSKPYPKTQAERWGQLEYAAKLDHDAAYQSASYGLFQIMGFNYAACNATTVDNFVAWMKLNERAHLEAFVRFLNSKNLARHLAARDWLAFATGYNGGGQASAYATRLITAYERFK